MKHISILVPNGAILGSLEGPRQVLTETNKFLQHTGRKEFCRIQLVGINPEISVCGGKYTVYTDATLHDIAKTDLIIIPAVDGDMEQILKMNEQFIPWIIRQYKEGAEVASLCVGAFLLASTGLIDGKNCATHWMAAYEFRRMFPRVNLVDDKILTDEHGIYSSGGAFSYLNLILYLIEKYAGKDVAIFMSKAFQIDYDRHSQSIFAMFQSQKNHGDDTIIKAQDYIESNINERISVDELADRLALGRRNLERRFKKATANSIIEYTQRVKIEAAKKALESSQENVNEVMYQVGYSDPKAFRSTFKRITGISPIQYKNKFGREIL